MHCKNSIGYILSSVMKCLLFMKAQGVLSCLTNQAFAFLSFLVIYFCTSFSRAEFRNRMQSLRNRWQKLSHHQKAKMTAQYTKNHPVDAKQPS